MTTEQRLDALERELGRTKRVNRLLLVVTGALVVAGVTGLTVTAQEKRATTLRARAFVLEDDDGRPRGGLSVTEYGSALALFGLNGDVQATLSLSQEGPSLTLFDANAKERVTLRASKDAPSLKLADSSGATRAALAVTADMPVLSLLDAAGKTRATLGTSADRSTLSLSDANGTARATLGTTADATTLGLHDSGGKAARRPRPDARRCPVAGVAQCERRRRLVHPEEAHAVTARRGRCVGCLAGRL
jgi:hypothetical protein